MSAYSDEVLSDTPLAFIRHGGNLTDSSGNSRNFTATAGGWTAYGPPLYPLDTGSGTLDYGGVSRMANNSGNWHRTGTYSIEAVVKLTSGSAVNMVIAAVDFGGQLDKLAYRLCVSPDPNRRLRILARPASSPGSLQTFDGPTLPLGTELHVVATNDGTTSRMYVNGAQVASMPAGPSILSTSGASIGNIEGAASTDYFRGRVGNVAFYGHALTADRVAAHYAALTVSPPDPPTGLTQTGSTPVSVDVAWTAPTAGGAPTSYELRVDGGTPTDVGLVTATTILGLSPGSAHTVEVRSVAAADVSAWAGPLDVTTATALPASPGIASQTVLSNAGLDPSPNGADAPAQQWWTMDASDVATYSAVRSEALVSYSIGYAAREPLGKPQPLSVGVVLLVPVGDAVAIGDRFLIRLSQTLADALGLAPADAIRATCIVTDVVSDPTKTWELPGHGTATLWNVTATGWLPRYGAATIDGTGWPTEPVGARIARILGSLGLAGDVDVTGPNVLPPTVVGSHHQALAPATDSTLGRVVEQRDGTVDYHDPEDRRGTLPALTLDASEIIGENFSWRQSVSDVVNEAEVTYGPETGDKVTVRDPGSSDPRSGVGPYPAQLSTALTTEADAYDLGNELVGRRAWPYYQLPAVTIDLARSGLELARVAAAFEVVNGHRVALTSMPAGSPWDTLPRGCFIEGYTETATAYAWRLTLVVSDPALSGVDLRWHDVPDSDAYQWHDLDPDLTWLDLARLEESTDLL